MTAKKEFIYHTQGKTIYCSSLEITNTNHFQSYVTSSHNLQSGYDEEELQKFLDSIDHLYTRLSGYIWYSDGTLSYRHSYIWRHSMWEIPKISVQIPLHLIRLDKERDKKINQILQ